MTMKPYCGITNPIRADRLLTLMIDGAAATRGNGFRAAPSGKHWKGRKPRKFTAVERLAAATQGKFTHG
jgi:hypothetical protein